MDAESSRIFLKRVAVDLAGFLVGLTICANIALVSGLGKSVPIWRYVSFVPFVFQHAFVLCLCSILTFAVFRWWKPNLLGWSYFLFGLLILWSSLVTLYLVADARSEHFGQEEGGMEIPWKNR